MHAWRLIDRVPFGIVAVTRGRLIPAAIARELDVRLVESVSVLSYAAGGSGAPAEEEWQGASVAVKPAAAQDGSGFLVVDDLTPALPRAWYAPSSARQRPADMPWIERGASLSQPG